MSKKAKRIWHVDTHNTLTVALAIYVTRRGTAKVATSLLIRLFRALEGVMVSHLMPTLML